MMLDAALDLAARGFAVFSLVPGTKIPHKGSKGVKEATINAHTLRQWWTRHPHSNIGLATGNSLGSGIIVIDIDIKHDINGYKSWNDLCARYEIDEMTYSVDTPSGGLHIYFGITPNITIRNSASRLGPGIDVRANGGYVVAPPSIINGTPYRGDGALDEIAPLPQVLCNLLAEKSTDQPFPAIESPLALNTYVQVALDKEIDRVRAASPGTRNETLNKAAFALGQLAGAEWADLDPGMVELVLLEAAVTVGLPQREAQHTIRSGLEAGKKEPRRIPEDKDMPSPAKRQKGGKKKSKTAVYTFEYESLFRRWGYTLRRNLCGGDIEANGKRLDNFILCQIRNNARDFGTSSNRLVKIDHVNDAISTVAAKHAYHPIKDYLRNLTWDGADHIDELAGHVESVNDLFGYWLRTWLVGAVARVIEAYQNPMLVLDGGQGIGKSYLARWLCPLEGYFNKGPIIPRDKDCRLRLAYKWIWEVDELGGTTRRADVEALKSFLTMPQVCDRKPYARLDETYPALSSFIGTVNGNDAGFLLDRSGNRRFLVCTVLKIDWGYADRVNPDQLWAQAVALYNQDTSWQLDSKGEALRDTVNQDYEIDDPIETLLNNMLEYTGNMQDRIPLPHLYELLRDKTNISQHVQAIAVANTMRRMGAEKKRIQENNQRQIVYFGVKIR